MSLNRAPLFTFVKFNLLGDTALQINDINGIIAPDQNYVIIVASKNLTGCIKGLYLLKGSEIDQRVVLLQAKMKGSSSEFLSERFLCNELDHECREVELVSSKLFL